MVKIYGTPNCAFCDAAKSLAEALNLEYKYTNIMEDDEAFQMFKDKGLKQVPQIWVKDNHIGGFTDFERLVK